MLNQLLRFTLVSSALLWLRPRWRGLLALTASVVLIHILHGEYLGYVELSGNSDFLVLSYVCKWVALTVVVSLYVLLAVYGLKSPVRKRGTALPDAYSPAKAEHAETGGAKTGAVRDDGFDFLRAKKTLESRADKVIRKNPR